MPPYASCILFDLYNNGTQNYVQIAYKKGDEDDGTVLNIPDCGTKCPLEKMYKLFEKILPQRNFEDECEFNLNTILPNNPFHFRIS